jgi:hypothetical protein
MPENSDEKLVIAPGGPRPASSVFQVGPDQVVSRDESGAMVVTAAPAQATDMVITPGGPRHRSRVHLVEAGQSLLHAEGQLQVVDSARNVVARLAAVTPLRAPRHAPAMGDGWITYAGWSNGTGTPISSFTTTWTVPRAPRTSSGQVIFLFNGIEPGDSSHILQPVLQWGVSAAGGGSYWSIASWYVGSGGDALHTPLVRVNEGDVLVGVMTLDSRSGSSFNYTSSFQGRAGTSLTVQNNPELTWASQTLEAYSVTKCSDYPATDTTPMTAINIRTGTSTPAVSWSVTNRVTDCGQKTVVAVNGATNAEVDLSYRGEAGWNRNDLTVAAHNAPLASGDPAGYTWDVDRTQHVVYRGTDGHVHELWFSNAWNHNDLTNASGGSPLAASDVAGYTWDVDRTQHVVYRAADNHIHELWFNNGWHHNDLTVAAGAPAAAGRPAGYTWSVDRTQHVVYRGVDGHIHELWYNNAWHHNDLTNASGGAPLAAGSPAGYTWSVDRTQHVVYRGLDGHVHELWYNNAWHHNDLTNASGGPPLAGGDPAGYTWDVDSTQHVVYRGGDSRIHEFWFNGQWNYNDLTSAAGNPPAATGKPAGYTWSVDRTEHVVYRTAAGHVQELWL